MRPAPAVRTHGRPPARPRRPRFILKCRLHSETRGAAQPASGRRFRAVRNLLMMRAVSVLSFLGACFGHADVARAKRRDRRLWRTAMRAHRVAP